MATASGRAWIGAAIGVVAVVVVAALIFWEWAGIGDTHMSVAGWIAMALGVLITLALGMGLMALVFISSRRGYDEPDRR